MSGIPHPWWWPLQISSLVALLSLLSFNTNVPSTTSCILWILFGSSGAWKACCPWTFYKVQCLQLYHGPLQMMIPDLLRPSWSLVARANAGNQFFFGRNLKLPGKLGRTTKAGNWLSFFDGVDECWKSLKTPWLAQVSDCVFCVWKDSRSYRSTWC